MQVKCYRFVTVLSFFCFFSAHCEYLGPENVRLRTCYEFVFHCHLYCYRRPKSVFIALFLKKFPNKCCFYAGEYLLELYGKTMLPAEVYTCCRQFYLLGIGFLELHKNNLSASAAVSCYVYPPERAYFTATTSTGEPGWGVCIPSISNG